jgi:hypothetical protein
MPDPLEPPSAPIDAVPTTYADEGPPRRPRRRGRIVAAIVVLVLLAGGVTAFLLTRGDDYPDEWDPRVADLAEFVEKERHLDFEHPVEIEFIEVKAFEKLLSADEAELTDEDEQDIEDAAAMFRALGMIDADVDLLESFSDIQSSGTLAYYSWDDEKIRVRGTKVTPGVRVTLAHELTHVLQDQHFDLGRIQDEADEEDADQQSDVLRGIAEGDATRIGEAYRESMSDDDYDASLDEEESDVEEFDADQYPPVLTALIGAPYALGEQLVALIAADDGDEGVDEVFVDPPRFDKALLDPLGYLAGEKGSVLDTPELADGETEIDSGGFGAFSLYLTLAQRLEPKAAMAAADTWAGDAYVAYRADDRVCVRTAFEATSDDGADRLTAAFEEWARPAPAGTARVERKGDTIVFQACDSEDGKRIGLDITVDDLFALPVTRAQIGGSILSDGGTTRQARCFANGVLEAFTLEQLNVDELPPAGMQRIGEIGESCR